jgi:hypothetical protein
MTDVYRDTDERYRNDPTFHAAVTMLEVAATEHGFTPGELKQIAFKAALNLEMRKLPSMVVLTELRPGEQPAPAPGTELDGDFQRFVEAKNRLDRKIHARIEAIAREADRVCVALFDEPTRSTAAPGVVAGHLKDGTPVYFGKAPAHL